MTDVLKRRTLKSALALFAAGAVMPRKAFALTAEEEIVEKCRQTVQSLLTDSNFESLSYYISRARGVMIFPNLIKGGFFVGAEGGSGVLLARLEDGSWSYPAFYFFGAASIGLQFGGQWSEAVLTFMHNRAVDAALENAFKLGADASVAVGPYGKGVEAGTSGEFDADIYTFARSEGLFGGISLEGGVLSEEQDRMKYYYGQNFSAHDIVRRAKASNSQANGLRSALNL